MKIIWCSLQRCFFWDTSGAHPTIASPCPHSPCFHDTIYSAVEDRKDWLRGFKAGTHADYNVESVTYESFINKELILFSVCVMIHDHMAA